ncbi:hypothetical protein AUP68_12113 [Ilyonectria robusta]
MPIKRVSTPPEDNSSYVLDRMDGEIQSMPGLRGVFRFYATEKQTDNKISVFAWDGPASDQPFHYHKKTHDCFLVVEGTMKVYCDGSSRMLGPGDFASVPPGLVHKPTPQGPITKAIPLINPADWVNAFRAWKQPFEGLMFPELDFFDRAKAAEETPDEVYAKYDSYPSEVPNPPEPLPWSEKDTRLPDGEAGYFLKCNTGPRWVLGGVFSRPFITTKQCSGKFAITCIETSSVYGPSVFHTKMSFPVHHVLVFFDGQIDITIGDEEEPLRVVAGEVVCLQANTPFSLDFKTKYVRFYSYTSGAGMESLIHEAGSSVDRASLADEVTPVDQSKLKFAIEKFNIKIHS